MQDGRGRPRREPRDVLNGILWILCVQEFRGRIFHHGILLVAASVIRQRLWLSSAGEFHPMLSKSQPVWLPDNLTHVEKKLFQF
ncbi:MAG: hypothetical protein WBZ05_03000 [Desulfobacterales bacterium]